MATRPSIDDMAQAIRWVAESMPKRFETPWEDVRQRMIAMSPGLTHDPLFHDVGETLFHIMHIQALQKDKADAQGERRK